MASCCQLLFLTFFGVINVKYLTVLKNMESKEANAVQFKENEIYSVLGETSDAYLLKQKGGVMSGVDKALEGEYFLVIETEKQAASKNIARTDELRGGVPFDGEDIVINLNGKA